MVEMIEIIQDPKLRAQAEMAAAFHGYLSPGALKIRMLNTALLVLDLSQDERIFFAPETCNCLPDPFPISAKAVIGNKGLQIEDSGKMAMTANKIGLAGSRTPAVQIFVKPALSLPFPRSLPLINNPPSEDLLCP